MKRKFVTVFIASQLCFGQLCFAALQDVKVQPIDGTNLKRLILSSKIVKRLGIQTAEVVNESTGQLEVIPYSALMYDKDGRTWLYTSPKSSVFVRHQIYVDHIEGDLAFIKSTLPKNTNVVSVGVIELTGIEFGVEHEDL